MTLLKKEKKTKQNKKKTKRKLSKTTPHPKNFRSNYSKNVNINAQCCFVLVSLFYWHFNLRELFNAEAILVEEKIVILDMIRQSPAL